MQILLAANETKPISIAGSQFYYLAGDAPIRVRVVGQGDARSFDLRVGMGFKDLPVGRFNGVEVTDLGGVGQTVSYEISDEEVFDNGLILSSQTGIIQTKNIAVDTISSRYTMVGVTGSTSETILSANVKRKRAILLFDGDMKICGSTGSNVTAYPVYAGYEYTTESTGAMKAFLTTAGDTVTVIEEVYP